MPELLTVARPPTERANRRNRLLTLFSPIARARFPAGAALFFALAAFGLAQTPATGPPPSPPPPPTSSSPPPTSPTSAETVAVDDELARVQNLVRADVLGLAREILETRMPEMGAATAPSARWVQWQRQLWALYRVRGQWRKLYQRIRQLPPGLPPAVRREADLLAVKSLTALGRGAEARNLIRNRLPAPDASQRHQRRLRQALIATYLAEDLLPEARIAMGNFRKDYGVGDTDWLLLSAGVLLRSGKPEAAINLLAPLDQPAARLLRLYARLGNGSLTPDQVIERARELRATPAAESLEREIQAVLAEANMVAGKPQPLAEALEAYLLAPPPRDPDPGKVYPRFTEDHLFDAYARIAGAEANKAGLLIGDEWRWLEHAMQMPAGFTVVRKSLFAWLAAAEQPRLRRRAADGYVNVLIDTGRTGLIARLFRPDTRLGALSLGGETGLRLSAHALNRGDFRLAAEANANLEALPTGVDRAAWLLQAGRIDVFAGRYRQGAAKLREWIEAFDALDPQQTDAILQPIFDLQTVERHALALELLRMVDARAPAGKYRREIAYWLAESYHGSGQYAVAADLFLHSALQQADGFDRWGEAARFRAAEALMDGELFEDARRLFEGLLARAGSDARRGSLKQKLQRLWLLESSLDYAPGEAPPDER